MAEAGNAEIELDAVFGWRGGRMAGHYTGSANRKRLGVASSGKLAGTAGERSIPAPEGEVRKLLEKLK
jgi:hypothetical protein